MPPSKYEQLSPLHTDDAEQSLELLAELHGIGWENPNILELGRKVLQPPTCVLYLPI
jgi:hypothetical protein